VLETRAALVSSYQASDPDSTLDSLLATDEGRARVVQKLAQICARGIRADMEASSFDCSSLRMTMVDATSYTHAAWLAARRENGGG